MCSAVTVYARSAPVEARQSGAHSHFSTVATHRRASRAARSLPMLVVHVVGWGGDSRRVTALRSRAMFEHLIEQPNVLFAAWRKFGVYLFEGEVSIADIDRIEMTGSQFFRKNPGKIVEMV